MFKKIVGNLTVVACLLAVVKKERQISLVCLRPKAVNACACALGRLCRGWPRRTAATNKNINTTPAYVLQE
jgi:hypothetical protein